MYVRVQVTVGYEQENREEPEESSQFQHTLMDKKVTASGQNMRCDARCLFFLFISAFLIQPTPMYFPIEASAVTSKTKYPAAASIYCSTSHQLCTS